MSDKQSKAYKVSSAIYFVTAFFDEKEPLKWRLRNLAIDISSDKLKDKSNIIEEVIALLGLAKNAGLISEANYNILSEELAKLEKNSEKTLYQMLLEESSEAQSSLSEFKKEEVIKDKIILSEPKVKALNKPLSEYGIVSVKKNSRQSTIIALLKRKKEIMIKDVASLIDDCSEKTIQRELLAMVDAGILKKIGEKRWSKYTLA